MTAGRRFGRLLLLLAMPSLAACAFSAPLPATRRLVTWEGLSSFRVQDQAGSSTYQPAGILVDPVSGSIEHLAIVLPLRGFDLDVRAAPLGARASILVPWRLVTVDVAGERMTLRAEPNDLLGAPRFSPLLGDMPSDWRQTVDQYWRSRPGEP